MFGLKYARFWRCFQKNETEVFSFESDQENVFRRLAEQLRRVHPDLVFEFSGIADGRREFVVSAGGIKAAFPQVTALVQAAPSLPRWQVIAFRQRKQAVPEIRYGGKRVAGESIKCDYVVYGEKVDLTVFIPELATASQQDRNDLMTVAFLFLDATLGEYDVETKLAKIDFVDASSEAGKRRISLEELLEIVDTLPSAIQ